MDKIIHRIVSSFIANGVVPEKQQELYEYCIGAVLETGLFAVTIIVLGIILHQFLPAVLFLVYFVACRSYTGGFHADKYWKCYLLSVITYLITWAAEAAGWYFDFNPLIADAVFVVCSVIQTALSPVDSINRQITEKKDIIRAKTAVIIVFAVFEVLYWVLWNCKLPGMRTIIASAVIVMVSQIAGKVINNNRRKTGR